MNTAGVRNRSQMKIILYLLLLFPVYSPSDYSKMVYQALYSGSLEEIKSALETLDKQGDDSQIRAYKGALLSKEADKLKSVADKVKAFKKGALMLEAEIEAFPDNVEYRFLRFAIQENSPAILGYHDNLEEDKKMIIDGYANLDNKLRKQISRYASKSEKLRPEELK